MGTVPPTAQAIDKWLAESGHMDRIISESYIPGQGFHVKEFVVAYTTNTGAEQFFLLGPNDPRTHQPTARQLLSLIEDVGQVNLREYNYTEAMPRITPNIMAAANDTQQLINATTNWAVR
jgi:hypothetical protein